MVLRKLAHIFLADFRVGGSLIVEFTMTDSQQLLKDYAATGLETAFRDLVTRYIDLVYSTACRLLDGDSHGAQDVAQTVFLDLALHARKLKSGTMLGGWLHRHTCFVAGKVVRGERRRQQRERHATQMNTLNATEARFADIAPLLDEIINELGDEDRRAILLRFYEKRDFRSVGEALGSSENAAQKRVSRALDQLHVILTRRGIALSVAALGAALAGEAVTAAPAGLSASVARLVLASAIGTSGVQFGVFRTIGIAKVTSGAAVVVAVATLLIAQHQSLARLREENQFLGQQVAQATTLLEENQRRSNLVVQASNTRPQLSELLRLRNEVGRLRQAAAERTATNENRVAATVNGKPIFASQVCENFDSMKPLIRRQFAAQPSVIPKKLGELWTNSLDSLIDRTLVVMDFDKRGLYIPDKVLEDAMAQDTGYNGDRERLRTRMIFGMMRQSHVSELSEPTQEEIAQYYDAHQQDFWTEDRANVSVIDLKKSQDADNSGVEETQRKEAVIIQTRIANGADFVSTVAVHEPKQGNITLRETCWYERSALRPELAKAAFSLQPGGVSDVVETSNDFFILRLLEKRPPEQQPLGEVTEKIQKNLLKQRREAAEKDWLDGLRNQAVIQRFSIPISFE
jgi:RNA polymerase sigma factor (sigma-70 family)